jgi:hypothetical protein
MYLRTYPVCISLFILYVSPYLSYIYLRIYPVYISFILYVSPYLSCMYLRIYTVCISVFILHVSPYLSCMYLLIYPYVSPYLSCISVFVVELNAHAAATFPKDARPFGLFIQHSTSRPQECVICDGTVFATAPLKYTCLNSR